MLMELFMLDARVERTLDEIVIAPFECHVWHSYHLESGVVVLVVEILLQPLRLLDIPHRASDVVSSSKQLVRNMTANKAISTSHEDSSARLDDYGRHCAGRILRGRGR